MGTLISLLRPSWSIGPTAQDPNTGLTLDPATGTVPSVNVEEVVDVSQSPSNPLPSTTMFALIIGIDDYPSSQLYGAVSDANAMSEFLQGSLEVPEDHIRMLLNAQASRNAIIDAFKAIESDERIQKGNPILIFFAGHGIERPAPRSWNTDGKIHCLLPHDYEDTNPIPGRTIGALLENIAKAKGNNITVIFDCCYSAGLARDKSDEYLPRTIDLDVEIADDLDRDIWRSRAGAIPDSFSYHGIRSHVLLAACGESERALERRGHGQFTTALLETLKDCVADTSLTYAQVLERIHINNQSPHCVGIHQHRMLFDVRMLSGRQVRYHARVANGREREYVVGAGFAHGISPRVEFTLYDARGQHLGVAVPVVDGIDEFHSTITSSEHLPQVSFAKLTRSGDVSVHLVPRTDLQETFKRMAGKCANIPSFQLVEDAKEAKLQVGMEGDQAVFTVLDEQVKKFGLTRLPRTTSLDSVAHVIRAASHYFWYLHLTNTNRPTIDRDSVTVDFYRLQRPFDDFELSDFELPFLLPIEPGLCQRDPTPVIDFVVDSKALYGIKIKNNISRDLYLNVFLFNNSSLSIVPCYIQSSAGTPEAPLKRNKIYTIGYGIVGTAPLGFSLEDGQDIDVAYLKFFFSTRPIDLTDIEQVSPFSGVDGQLSADGNGRVGGAALGKRNSQDIWFTMVIPVVQRRA